jgi:hypothetical protein
VAPAAPVEVAPVEVAPVEVVAAPPEPPIPVDVFEPVVWVAPVLSFVEQVSSPTTSVTDVSSAAILTRDDKCSFIGWTQNPVMLAEHDCAKKIGVDYRTPARKVRGRINLGRSVKVLPGLLIVHTRPFPFLLRRFPFRRRNLKWIRPSADLE